MDATDQTQPGHRLAQALKSSESSVRMQAALTAGTYPNQDYVDVLIERSAVEPDLFVRETLTWALMRHPVEVALPAVLGEATAAGDQALSQALHTLSKIRDPRGWSVITRAILQDPDERVAPPQCWSRTARRRSSLKR